MNMEEVRYLCGKILDARTSTEEAQYVAQLQREFQKGEIDEGWLSSDRPMPGTKQAVKFVGPLELLGIPLKTDPNVQPGKIELRLDGTTQYEIDLNGDDQFGL